MQLILLERVEGLGNVGDEVSVRPGYGRNFLIPQGKGIVVNEGNRNLFERRRAVLEANHHTELEAAEAEAGKLVGVELSVVRATSDGEHLYGSVTTNEIAELLTNAGHATARRNILLDEQIKTVGDHPFRVRLHPDVTADMTVKVEAESV
ncbi:MAG: 50S ribosomal protein L9 [Mariprofundaceae bacterium]